MNKFKNYSFMCGLISAILMVVVQILAAFEIYISNETVSTIVSVILGGLVVIGVVNKPTEDQTNVSDKIDEAITNEKSTEETDKNNDNKNS